jgi:hypothetical protein
VKRVVAMGVALLALSLTACDSERVDPLAVYAASSCATVQTWVDSVEDYTKELSDAVTTIDRSSERVGYYRVWARSLHERVDDTRRQLKRIAPKDGDGAVAAATWDDAMTRVEAITDELITLADSFPDGDDDPEPVISRISSLLIRMEKGFSIPSKARDRLAERYPTFDEVPACVDYDEPVT